MGKTRNRHRKNQIHRTKKHKQKGGALTSQESAIVKKYTDTLIHILGVDSPFRNIWRTSVYEYVFNIDYKGIPVDPVTPQNNPTAQTKEKVRQVQYRLFCWIKDNMPNAVVKMPKGTIFCRTLTRTDMNQVNVLQLNNKKGTLTPKPGTYSNTSMLANVNVQVTLPIDSVMFLKTNKDLYYLNIIPFLHLMGMQYKDRLLYVPYGDVSYMNKPRLGISANAMEWATSFALNKLGLNGIIQMDYVENIRDNNVTQNSFFFKPSQQVNQPCTIGAVFHTLKQYSKPFNQVFEANSYSGVNNYFPEFGTYNFPEMVNWDILDLESEVTLFNAATPQEQAAWPNMISVLIQGGITKQILDGYKLTKVNYLNDVDNFSSPQQWTKHLPDGTQQVMNNVERAKKFNTKKQIIFKTFKQAKKPAPILYSLSLYNEPTFQQFGANLSNLGNIVFQHNPGMGDLSAEVFRNIESTKATHKLEQYIELGPYHNTIAELPKDIELLNNFQSQFCDMKEECVTGNPCCKLDAIPICEEGNGDFMKVKADATNNFYYNYDFNFFVAKLTKDLIDTMLYQNNIYTAYLGKVLMGIILQNIDLGILIKNIAIDAHIQTGDAVADDDGIDLFVMTLLGHKQSDKKDRIMSSIQERQVVNTIQQIRIMLTNLLKTDPQMITYIHDMTQDMNDSTDRKALITYLRETLYNPSPKGLMGKPIDIPFLTLFCNIYLKGGTSFKLLLNYEILKEDDRSLREKRFNRLVGWKNQTNKIEEKLGAPSDYDCNCVINPYLGEKTYIEISDALNIILKQYMTTEMYNRISTKFKIGSPDTTALQRLLLSNPLKLNLHIDIDTQQTTSTAARIDGENYERSEVANGTISSPIDPVVVKDSFAFYSKGPMLWITDDDDQAVTQFDLHRLMLNAPLVQICEAKDNKLGLGTRDINGKTCYVTYSSAYVAVELVDVSVVNWGGLERVQKWQDSIDGLLSDSLYTLYEKVKYDDGYTKYDGIITNVYPFSGYYQVTITNPTNPPTQEIIELVHIGDLSKIPLVSTPTLGFYNGKQFEIIYNGLPDVTVRYGDGTVATIPSPTTPGWFAKFDLHQIVCTTQNPPDIIIIVGMHDSTGYIGKKYDKLNSRFEDNNTIWNVRFLKEYGWSLGIQMYQFKNSVHDLMVTLQDTIKGGRMAKVLKRQRRLALLAQLYYTFVHIPTNFTKMSEDGPLSVLKFDGYEAQYTIDPINSMHFLQDFFKLKLFGFDAIDLFPVDSWGRIYIFIQACITIHTDKVNGLTVKELGYLEFKSLTSTFKNALANNMDSIFLDEHGQFQTPPISQYKWTLDEKKKIEIYFINVLTQMISILYDSNTLGSAYPIYAMQVLMYNLLNDTYIITTNKNMFNRIEPLNALDERIQSYLKDIAEVGSTVINHRNIHKETKEWHVRQENNIERVLMDFDRRGYSFHNIKLILKYESAKSIYDSILQKNTTYDFTHMDIASSEKVELVFSEMGLNNPSDYIEYTGKTLYFYARDDTFDITLLSLITGADTPPKKLQWPASNIVHDVYSTDTINPPDRTFLDSLSFIKYPMICTKITIVPSSTESISVGKVHANIELAYRKSLVLPPTASGIPSLVPILSSQRIQLVDILSVYNIYTEQVLIRKQIAKSTNMNELKLYVDQLFSTMNHSLQSSDVHQTLSQLTQLGSSATIQADQVKQYSIAVVDSLNSILYPMQQEVERSTHRFIQMPSTTFSLASPPKAYVIDLDLLNKTLQAILVELANVKGVLA